MADILCCQVCFLLDVDNKKINLQNFINEHFFNSDGYNLSYANFALNVLVPFKNSVMQELGCKEDGTLVEEETEFEEEIEEIQEEVEEPEDVEAEGEFNMLFENLIIALNEFY